MTILVDGHADDWEVMVMKLKGKKVVLLAENNYQELELWVPY